MLKEILTGLVTSALLVSPLAFAQAPDGLVVHTSELIEVSVPEAALERLAGRYTTQNRSAIVVTRAGNRLVADLAGLTLEFAPSGPNEFFIHGTPLTLSFAPGEAGKAQGLVVRENGTVIMQASASR